MGDPVVSFRDADEPRPLVARFIAVATRQPPGWRVDVNDGGVIYAATFEAAAEAVTASTGVRRLLIHWLTH